MECYISLFCALKEESQENKQEIIDALKGEDDIDFEYWPSEEEKEIEEIIISGYPEEINEKIIEEYKAIYVHNPKAKFLMLEDEDFGDVASEDASVLHTGLKQILPRYVKIAPGRTAYVKKASQVPLDGIILRCANCLGTGHLRFSCNLEKKCFKCQREGHVASECKKCANCKRFGHELSKCCKQTDKNKKKDVQSVKPQESNKNKNTVNITENAQNIIDRSLQEMGRKSWIK